METTNKISVQQLISQLWQRGLTHIVISPGSRNAPLILGFTSHSKYKCFSVPDERTAGFVALGMAQQLQQPVALVCSSGSALLNYYPAIAEAFYRKIPLVVLSADRPERLVDQGDGQTIRQKNVYANHILYSSQLEEFPEGKTLEENFDIIQTALDFAIPSPINGGGPVHLNLPFEEPLYHRSPFSETISEEKTPAVEILNEAELDKLLAVWKSSKKIMVLVGQKNPNSKVDAFLTQLGMGALILSETTSNIKVPHAIGCIDRLITTLSEEEKQALQPEVLITFGGNVVSKRIKAFLRSFSPKHHAHIEIIENAPDTYQCLNQHFKNSDAEVLGYLSKKIASNSSEYVNYWLEMDKQRTGKQQEFEKTVPFSDFQVMETIKNLIPPKSILHLANSTPVRYAQLFDWKEDLIFDANRGTSGIDGIVSTAMGTAICTDKPVVLIVGDISFFYDTNAWWHRHIPNNLKVVVINNNGGGIFRFIDGPNSTGQLESFFETHQKNSVKHIALGFGVPYFCAKSKLELEENFKALFQSEQTGILEVETPQIENAGILKAYFKSFQKE